MQLIYPSVTEGNGVFVHSIVSSHDDDLHLRSEHWIHPSIHSILFVRSFVRSVGYTMVTATLHFYTDTNGEANLPDRDRFS